MPLNKVKENSNMYQGWVTHTHTHLGGRCPHECMYCYVDNPRFGRPEKYQGKLRLIEKEFMVKYGNGKSIFMENCNDLFAQAVPYELILRVLEHCRKYPRNTYILQTKNPIRYIRFVTEFPPNVILGTTIETNRDISDFSKAPHPYERFLAMRISQLRDFEKFVTIEPIMQFDLEVLYEWIKEINPDFVNIGADSKGNNLPEPEWEKVSDLIESLKTFTEVNIKSNLERLKKNRMENII